MSSSTGLRTERVLLFSGGLDSFILWHLLGYPTPVYVTLGHKYEQQELATIERLGIDVVTLAGPQMGHLEQADGHIPQRNLLLAATVAAALQPDIIYLGAVRGETSRDKSGRFLGMTSRLLSFCEQPVKVLAPARRWTKTQLVRRFLYRLPDGMTYLLATRSCYAATDLPCGRCQSCFRRWVAMSNNGIDEQYATKPWENAHVDYRYLWRSPLVEWPGVLHNQLDAARAIRRARRAH